MIETVTMADLSHALSLEEDQDITALPDIVIKEIKSNIRKGATDLEQDWANALELVNKAYQVTQVSKPTPDQKGAWGQYVEMISFAVKQLTATRGIDGDWRSSQVLFTEEDEDPELKDIGNKRFFASIPGVRDTELDVDSMDDAINTLSASVKRHGGRLQVDHREPDHAKVSIWVGDSKQETMLIREL